MYVLGISCYYHDSAAALIKDGEIIAACAEERFTRVKHDSSFPVQAINFCLEFAGIKPSDLDYVVFYEKPFRKLERHIETASNFFPHARQYFVRAIQSEFQEKLWIKSKILDFLKIPSSKLMFVPHHLSHAAAAFYPSPFNEAAFLTLDGVGEWTTGLWGLAKGSILNPMGEMRFPDSIGLLYSTMTAFLGFEVNEGEYKVMGLAAYGRPRYKNLIQKLYCQNTDSSINLNLEYFSFHLDVTRMYSQKFADLFANLDKADLAASLQKCTEEIILNIAKYVKKQTKQKYLVFGGGVALNSVVNAKLALKSGFEDIFIYPAAGDDGGAVGCGLYVYHHILQNEVRFPIKDMFLGPSYSGHKKLNPTSIAKRLAQGKIVAFFTGRSEFGPRALGHRSILADPRDPKMKDRVNTTIKYREEFRPFAPVVMAEFADKYFENINWHLSPFMLGTFKAKAITKKQAPAIVHVDGTSRIQTVSSGPLYKILKEFYVITGVPILLNTSFNLKGEPIVNSQVDAYNTFKNSNLDMLVLGNEE